jgi:uncharacterized protein (TIGR02646 family)
VIRLNRGAPPAQLDAATVAALTAEYLATEKSVWNVQYIRDALLALSGSKCAYCETNIAEESKYMEVEHFRCKEVNPLLVVEWTNLLPSCKRCNVRKGSYDVDAEGMILNPFSDNPGEHLYFKNYRVRWRSDLGRRTVDAIETSLEKIRDELEEYLQGQQTTRKKNRVVRGLEKLLLESRGASEMSALAATILFEDPNYVWIRENLIALDLWAGLTALETSAQANALPG